MQKKTDLNVHGTGVKPRDNLCGSVISIKVFEESIYQESSYPED